ncbi:hypothetical protein [Marinactinospora rubrisoli]|uniref:DUF8175 domain-containing protein n=1 Tax=Marinactinospora rubrisoli TaxID=2715399 RepID=A0ABW2KIY7_9ACTN
MAESDNEDIGGNPLATRGFILSAAVIGVVLVLAVVVVISILWGEDDGDPDATPSPGASSQPAASDAGEEEPAGEASVCGLDDVEMEGTLTEAPPDTEWELLGPFAVPSVEGAGPGRVEDDGFRDCYARTPTGALLAATNLAVLTSVPGLNEQAAAQLMAEGPGRDAALAEARNVADAGTSPEGSIQVAGFRFISYSGAETTVQIAYNTSVGAVAVLPVQLVWENGDWKAIVSEDGELPVPPYEVPDLTGFVRWSGA